MLQVDKWWSILLPMIAPFLYGNGGPIIMVQVCTFVFPFPFVSVLRINFGLL